MVPGFLIFLIKSVLSFTYDFVNNVVGGVRKLSISCEIFSVGHPLADTMGLPGGGILPLCIFGRR